MCSYYVIIILLAFTIKTYGDEHNYSVTETEDQLGRIVKLSKSARRIISLAPSITEIIFSLEAQSRLVGVTECCDYPVEAKLISTIGSYMHPDLEKIVALEPDLCLAVNGSIFGGLINWLELLDIPVYIVDPKNINSVLSTVTSVGSLLGAEARAIALIDILKKRMDRVKAIVSKSKYSPRIFFQLGASPIISASKNTFIDDLITLTRGINVVDHEESYPRLSREDVLRLAPEVIVVTSMGNDDALSKEKFQWEIWPELPATSNGYIFVENANLFDRPSPRLIDGLELLARRIHPELFEEYS